MFESDFSVPNESWRNRTKPTAELGQTNTRIEPGRENEQHFEIWKSEVAGRRLTRAARGRKAAHARGAWPAAASAWPERGGAWVIGRPSENRCLGRRSCLSTMAGVVRLMDVFCYFDFAEIVKWRVSRNRNAIRFRTEVVSQNWV